VVTGYDIKQQIADNAFWFRPPSGQTGGSGQTTPL
jgi:hypothetical protein